MSEILGLSFETAASPSIRLETPPGRGPGPGWGFAWYPGGGRAAAVVKDPISTGDTPMTRILRDWDHFRAVSFICHIRGAARRAAQQDTHPFTRSYAGRDFALAHNGDLDPARVRALSLGDAPAFEPIGSTDTEWALCWVLRLLRDQGFRTFEEAGWSWLHARLGELDALGTANFLLSDGDHVIAYRDDQEFQTLYAARFRPPIGVAALRNDTVHLELPDPGDHQRALLAFATSPMDQGDWVPLPAGALIVARRGAVVHCSHPEVARALGEKPRPQVRRQAAAPPEGDALPAARYLRVVHRTRYDYASPVLRSDHVFRLKPEHRDDQELIRHRLRLSVDGERRLFEDVFGNQAARYQIRTPYSQIVIEADSTVAIHPSPDALASTERRTAIPLLWMPWQREMMAPFLLPSELPESQLRALNDYAMSFVERQDYDLVGTLIDMNETIYRDFEYRSGATTLSTTPYDVFDTRKGVCQDFANLFICLCRLLHIPARYRVGYLYTGAKYDNRTQAEASHAWAEVYLPWVGWRGFDPTNGVVVRDDHIRTASGRTYVDATPTSGTIYLGGGGERLQVKVEVTEITAEQARQGA